MSLHIAIIPGHGHRQTSRGAYRWDPGAVSELGREAEIVRAIAARALQLGRGRVTVHDSDQDGPWSYTWRRNKAHAAIGSGPGVVVHLHVNAGGGDYLLGMHDPRSSTGAAYAARWCSAVGAAFDLSPRKCKTLAAKRPTWANAANLVEPSYLATPAGVAAVLLEVGFIDNPAHARLLTGDAIERQAAAILAAWE
jgi:N-acetylmuramoyl-L-alanine amidase